MGLKKLSVSEHEGCRNTVALPRAEGQTQGVSGLTQIP